MLCFFVSCLLPIETDFRIAFTMCDSCHAKVHTNLRTLTIEVCFKLIEDKLLILVADFRVVLNSRSIYAKLMLCSQCHRSVFYFLELICASMADWALCRSCVTFINISTYCTYKFHNKSPFILSHVYTHDILCYNI